MMRAANPHDTSRAGPTNEHIWESSGVSMLPFLLPRCRLHLRLRDHKKMRISPGDVVCYVGADGRMIAHRVVRVRWRTTARELDVKGDAQRQPEVVAEEAVFAVVTRVEQRLVSYNTEGALGSAIATLVVHAPTLVTHLAGAMRALIQTRRALLNTRAGSLFRGVDG